MGYSVIIGLNCALDSLVSTAAGAGELELCGVYLNRQRLIVTMVMVPMLGMAMKLEEVLVLFGQDPVVSAYTAQYIWIYLPGLYMRGLQMCQVKFLNNLGKTRIPMFCNIAAVAIHPLWCYIYVYQWGMKLNGIGLANVTSLTLLYTFTLAYSLYLEDIRPAMFFPDHRTFTGIMDQLKLGVQSAFMICLDIWAGCLVMFFAAYISVSAQGAQVILN